MVSLFSLSFDDEGLDGDAEGSDGSGIDACLGGDEEGLGVDLLLLCEGGVCWGGGGRDDSLGFEGELGGGDELLGGELGGGGDVGGGGWFGLLQACSNSRHVKPASINIFRFPICSTMYSNMNITSH